MSTAAAAGPLRIVVEGHLPPTSSSASQSVPYDLKVEGDAAGTRIFSGDFTERWGTQRIGRHGYAPVRIVRSSSQHEIEGAQGGELRVTLDRLQPANAHSVGVSVHPDSFPLIPFATLGFVPTGAATAIDTWRAADPGDETATMLTLCAFLGVASFRRFAPVHPGLGDVMFNGVLGGIAGLIGGSVLWRVAGAPLKRRLAAR